MSPPSATAPGRAQWGLGDQGTRLAASRPTHSQSRGPEQGHCPRSHPSGPRWPRSWRNPRHSAPWPRHWRGSKAGHSCTPGHGQDVPKSGTEAAGRGFINSIPRSFGLFIYPAANSVCCINPHLEIIQRNPPAQPSPRARAQTRCHEELQPQLIPSAATG